MFGKLWQWIEDSVYAALTRGVQRWVNDNTKPDAEGERPQLGLILPPVLQIEQKKGRKAE